MVSGTDTTRQMTLPQECTDITEQLTTIVEGKAKLKFRKEKVFYNPVQQFNRDLSIVAIHTWSLEYSEKQLAKFNRNKRRKLESGEIECFQAELESNGHSAKNGNSESPYPAYRILEALSATGLRSIRYALELPNLREVVANDNSKEAVQNIEEAIKQNYATGKVHASLADANAYMHSQTFPFEVIDLDPYGSAAPFIDAAVRTVADGGLLCITCTDLRILAGNSYYEKCYSLYGGLPTKNTAFCHETALRLVIHSIASSAGRYGKSIEPVLSLSIDFYVRVFIKVHSSPASVKLLASQTMITYFCIGCESFYNQPLMKSSNNQADPNKVKFQTTLGPPTNENCRHCDNKLRLAGPMWAGPLHSPPFTRSAISIANDLDSSIYGTKSRIIGMLTLANEELPDPFFYSISHLAKCLRSSCPPKVKVVSALLHAGYQCSLSHAMPGSIKTNAPSEVMWDIMRKWVWPFYSEFSNFEG